MSAKLKPEVKPDPAGLDQLLLAAGKGVARFIENAANAKYGLSLNLWDGRDGLGAVLTEHLQSAGIPNKRLPELVTPRAFLQQAGIVKKRPPARRRKA